MPLLHKKCRAEYSKKSVGMPRILGENSRNKRLVKETLK